MLQILSFLVAARVNGILSAVVVTTAPRNVWAQRFGPSDQECDLKLRPFTLDEPRQTACVMERADGCGFVKVHLSSFCIRSLFGFGVPASVG